MQTFGKSESYQISENFIKYEQIGLPVDCCVMLA